MATNLLATVKAAIAATYQNALEFGSVEQKLQYNISNAFTDGTGADQAQKLWTDQRTLTASSTEDLDLAGGVNDVFGTALSFSKVKALIVKAAPGNTNDVVVGGAAANGLITFFGASTDKVKVKPGGTLMLIAPDANGYGVTAGTGDLLRIGNGGAGTSVTYDITVLGV